jgi:hypothetical protein
LFESTQGALDASEDFRRLAEAAQLSTALPAPAPESVGGWTATKVKLVGSEWLATEVTGEFATRLKDYTQRERPNGEDDLSCPSYDATSAAIRTHLTNLNIEYLPVEDDSKTLLSLASSGIGALASWSRVEAGKHYPSDVLLGWAPGNFFGYPATDLIAPDRQQQFQVRPQIFDDTTGVALILRFQDSRAHARSLTVRERRRRWRVRAVEVYCAQACKPATAIDRISGFIGLSCQANGSRMSPGGYRPFEKRWPASRNTFRAAGPADRKPIIRPNWK